MQPASKSVAAPAPAWRNDWGLTCVMRLLRAERRDCDRVYAAAYTVPSYPDRGSAAETPRSRRVVAIVGRTARRQAS